MSFVFDRCVHMDTLGSDFRRARDFMFRGGQFIGKLVMTITFIS